MASQMLLPGFEPLPVGWRPILHKAEKVKDYFMGYVANGREIYASRPYVAAKLGMSVRTLARYLKWLVDTGWMATIRRTSRTAYRQVLQGPVPSPVPSQAPVSLLTEVPPEAQSKQHHSESSCVSTGDDVACVLSQRPIVTNPDSKPLREAVARVGKQTVLNAIWLGCIRKIGSMVNSGNHNKISSARYFLPIIDEIERDPVGQSYFDYVEHKVRREETRWAKTA